MNQDRPEESLSRPANHDVPEWRRVMRSRLGLDTTWSFILKAIYAVLAFFLTVVLARVLGAEGYGIYAYAYSLVMLLALPAQAGLPQLIVRETAQGLAAGRPDLVRGAWRWAGKAVAILSIVVVSLAGPLLVIWQGGLASSQGQTLAFALALIPLIALTKVRGAALRGLKRIVAGQLPEYVVRPGFFLISLGLTILFIETLTPSSAMAIHVVAAFTAFSIGAWMLRRWTPSAVRRTRPHPGENHKGWFASSVIFALLAGLGAVNSQASTVILGILGTSSQVGVYRVAVQIATLAAFGLQAVNLVVAPRFAELSARGDMWRLQRLVTTSARAATMFAVLVAVVFLLVGRPFVNLAFGSEFAASYGPLLILLLGQVANSAVGSVAFLLNMTGHERKTLSVIAGAAVLNVVLNATLIPLWGISGAALATTITMVIWNFSLWLRARSALAVDSFAFSSRRDHDAT